MYQIQFDKPVHVHFIGIGGISMSGLAEILLSRKFPVSGSDTHESALTDQLAAQGAVIHYPRMISMSSFIRRRFTRITRSSEPHRRRIFRC